MSYDAKGKAREILNSLGAKDSASITPAHFEWPDGLFLRDAVEDRVVQAVLKCRAEAFESVSKAIGYMGEHALPKNDYDRGVAAGWDRAIKEAVRKIKFIDSVDPQANAGVAP